jgi:hypothetical protein
MDLCPFPPSFFWAEASEGGPTRWSRAEGGSTATVETRAQCFNGGMCLKHGRCVSIAQARLEPRVQWFKGGTCLKHGQARLEPRAQCFNA